MAGLARLPPGRVRPGWRGWAPVPSLEVCGGKARVAGNGPKGGAHRRRVYARWGGRHAGPSPASPGPSAPGWDGAGGGKAGGLAAAWRARVSSEGGHAGPFPRGEREAAGRPARARAGHTPLRSSLPPGGAGRPALRSAARRAGLSLRLGSPGRPAPRSTAGARGPGPGALVPGASGLGMGSSGRPALRAGLSLRLGSPGRPAPRSTAGARGPGPGARGLGPEALVPGASGLGMGSSGRPALRAGLSLRLGSPC